MRRREAEGRDACREVKRCCVHVRVHFCKYEPPQTEEGRRHLAAGGIESRMSFNVFGFENFGSDY